ncbi:slipin family protein [Neptunitalea lumnitzerae]|uniref:Peptidase n=1 Tax=Neptunitalea lumnitzerae TaxID=2965509 RepID=A0ABQ5MM19_9FLAO|nr:slipin family protein [Neptunitalea sp. Y10]GLB50351.1 peptidase [Neptunitalea sp. Y10]
MKRIRINKGNVGLVFKKGDYQRVLTAGIHWLGFAESVTIADERFPFKPTKAPEILLQDKQLASMLHVVDVKDNEIVLLYENGRYRGVLITGIHYYWNTLKEFTFLTVDKSKIYITEQIDKMLFSRYELSQHVRVFEVGATEKAVMIVDDVYVKTLGAGTYRFWKNDTTIKIVKTDMRVQQMEIAGQELLTKDKAAIRVNFFAQYKVVNIETALLENKDFEKQAYIAMQLALRAYIGAYTLDELLEQKEGIADAVFAEIKPVGTKLGIEILSCGIRDVILTGEMKDIMNQVLIAQKQAQANVITRREETASTRSLLNTAKLMEENEMLFKLKEMEFVEKIAEKIGEITVSGNGSIAKQLMDVFSVHGK